MRITSQLKLPFRIKKNKLRLDLPIAQRLTLGFLIAALIAGLLAGSTALIRIQSLHQQSDFYQQLLQTKTTLATGNDLLELMNTQMHEILTLANDPISVETLQDDENQLRNLINRYNVLLKNYATNDLLKHNPDQVSLLSEAHQDTLVTTQEALASSALRTWGFFSKAQLQILSSIKSNNDNLRNITSSINMEHLQGEPTFSDAQSAMVALIRFNDTLSQSARDAVTVEESNQFLTTIISIIFAIVSIALVGLFISNTVVHRLKQLHQVTKAVEQGEVKDRLHVIGRDEIADISASVNAMLEIIASEQAIVTASELKDQFIASVSHELRNPLTNVFGWLEILTAYREQLDEETQTRFLNRAMEGCQELMQIVNSVLDATQVGRGMSSTQLETVRLNPIIQSVLDNMDPRITQQYYIKTVMPEEFFVLADTQYIRQILRNLLTNACKYSPKDSTITLSIAHTHHPEANNSSSENDHLYICVKDTGPGIPAEEIPHLFQKFVRLQRDKSIRGTGLGLYLCKQLVESMGGRIWVESTGIAGEGSSFFFTVQKASPVIVTANPHLSPVPSQKIPV